MPLQFDSPFTAQAWCQEKRNKGNQIGFVATMGALHAGHASLFERAHAENDAVIASIFINPLQFNKAEDLEKYPRKNAEDMSLLDSIGVEAVFTGTPAQVLGNAENKTTEALPDPGEYAKGLEGVYRPGHFEGVREVVSRLFGFVGPCRTYFGEKDFQQVKIIEQLAANMEAIKVVACATSREASGLARSSRNFRLSDKGIADAAIIFEAMQAANTLWKRGGRQPQSLQSAMLKILDRSVIDLEYAEIRDPENWTEKQPDVNLSQARAFIAGNIEGVRLIDNMAMS